MDRMAQIQAEAERQGVEALFPRVHVRETRVSGLRAPPRNKMALFEQFTIPPHRFVPPPAQQSSHQEFSSDGRFDTTSYYVKPTISHVQYHKAGQVKRRQLSAAESSGSGVSCDKDKHQVSSGSVTKAKLCCSVVTSNHTAALALGSRDCNPLQINLHTKKLCQGPSSESAAIHPVYQKCLWTDIQPPHCKVGSRQVSKDTMAILCCGHMEVESSNAAVQSASKDTPSSTDKMDSLCCGHIEVEASNAKVQSASKDASSSKDTMASLSSGYMEVELEASNDGIDAVMEKHWNSPHGASNGNRVKDFEVFVSSVAPSDWSAERSPGIEFCGGKTMPLIERGSHEYEGENDTTERMQEKLCSEHTGDKETLSDRNSEIAGNIISEKHHTPIQGSALVNKSSVFSPKIIPKHVIDVVGQREFWEARKTILQQQKTLSLQVFELHRLVKVQQLIAGMPGLLLEENDKRTVLKSVTEPVYAKVLKGLDDKQSADKEAKYCTGQKSTALKQPKKLIKVSSHHDSTKVYKQYNKPPPQLHPPSSPLVLFGQSRVSSWGLPSSPFVGNQWVKAVSDKYGSLATHIGNVSSSLVSGSVSMALQAPMPYPIAGQWYNDHQVWQASSNVFMGWYRPCTPKDLPEVVIPPPVSQKPSANCGISHLEVQQSDFAPGAQATDCVSLPNRPRSALRKTSASTSRPLLSTQVDMPISNVQQVNRTSQGRQSSDLNKLGSQESEPTQDLHALERTGSRSLPGSREIESERSGMRSQKIDSRCFYIGHENTRSTQSDGCVKVVQPASAGVFSLNERCGGPNNGPLPLFPLAPVSSVENETDRLFISESPPTSKVIRAVPHSGTAAVQSAAKILKSIQQDWHH